MPKSFTKIWLGGLKRLFAIQSEHARETLKRTTKSKSKPKRAATRPAAVPKPSAKVRQAATRDVPQHGARESRVRPRAAAWAGGTWTRSFHSAPAAPGSLVNHLQYGLYLPAGKPRKDVPLIVMLHGCKQSIDEFAEGTRMNLLADRYGFAVVYPEQSKHAHAHRCWHWYDDTDRAGRGEARSVVSLVDALVDSYGFDPERVYVAGLSAGAGLAALLALHFPDRFAAVGLHSGPAFGEAHSGITAMDVMRRGTRQDPVTLVDAVADVTSYPGMPAIILQGESDRVVAPVNADQLTEQFLRLNGIVDAQGLRKVGDVKEDHKATVTTRDYTRGGRRVVRLCHVQGLGHAWSGGDDTVPFHSSKGPDASSLLWDFFKHQRRTESTRSAGRATEGARSRAS